MWTKLWWVKYQCKKVSLTRLDRAIPHPTATFYLLWESNQQQNIISMTCRATDDTKGYRSSRWTN